MTINPYDSPQTEGQVPERKPWRFTLVELLVVVGVIVVIIGLLLPNVRMAGGAARRAACSNNLKQIAIALLNYQDEYHCLPPAYTVDAEGKPLHSWRTLILPYLEQQALYDKIDLSKPWDDPANRAAYETRISVYQCPAADVSGYLTTYLAVVSPNSCLQAAAPRKLSEITDGCAQTLMVMEVDAQHAVHWMSPTDASEQMILSFGQSGRLSHVGGAQAAMVDGSIRFLSNDTKPATLRALISVAGNDDEVARQAD
jgi:type II secretory pathway pseudopilin PulG